MRLQVLLALFVVLYGFLFLRSNLRYKRRLAAFEERLASVGFDRTLSILSAGDGPSVALDEEADQLLVVPTNGEPSRHPFSDVAEAQFYLPGTPPRQPKRLGTAGGAALALWSIGGGALGLAATLGAGGQRGYRLRLLLRDSPTAPVVVVCRKRDTETAERIVSLVTRPPNAQIRVPLVAS